MRKITPVLESELPELPDGWRWVRFGESWASKDGQYTWETECCINGKGVMIGHVSKYSPSPVPLEVIAALLKANGVEL